MEEQKAWKAVLRLLEKMEWQTVNTTYNDGHGRLDTIQRKACPICGWSEEGPHSEDCALSEAMYAINSLLWSKEYV